MLKDATIVFDLDGTLVDTAPDLMNALNDVLTRRGHEPVEASVIRAAVGRGARVMIEEALRMAGTEDDLDQMLAEFLVYYEANIAAESHPYPGARDTLERFATAGAKLAVCTNKREYLSRKLLQELELEGYLAAIAGRDTFPVAKPDPRHLLGAISLAGGDPSRALMVGDSNVDFRTANAANVPIVLVSFGYGPAPQDGSALTIGHFAELEERARMLLTRLTEDRRSPVIGQNPAADRS
jgi:phosphoglycolate phosphatase